jgi:hypothetical protein
MYAIIGWIAVQIALGHSGSPGTPVGAVALWLLVAGSPGRPWDRGCWPWSRSGW